MDSTLLDLKVGDIVELDCPKLLNNTRGDTKIIGIIDQIFDALNKDGSRGNLEIDIRYQEKWVRYKPLLDGGKITVQKRKR